jgi:hypothetical protein
VIDSEKWDVIALWARRSAMKDKQNQGYAGDSRPLIHIWFSTIVV